MSSLTSQTKRVWGVTIYREDKIIVEYDIEFFDEETAYERAELLVSQYIEQTNVYHHAEIKSKIVPIYM